MMKRIVQFEILEAKLRDEVITAQSEKHEILVKSKGLKKKIASVTIDLTGMKSVNEKPEKYNELLAEDSKHQNNLNETLCHENSEVLRVKKGLEKILEQLCAENT